MKLRISAAGASFEVVLNETPTAKALLAVYFTTPVSAKLEPDARQIVDPGTVCFWTEGDALALPYGRTPLSSGSRPKLASRCNVLGKIVGDARVLSRIKSGDPIKVEKA